MNLLAFLCVAVCARAQDPSAQTVIARATNLDVREALHRLFKALGVSYRIDEQVQGIINVDRHGDTFESALQDILRQVNATYRCEGGIYQVIPIESPTGNDPAHFDPPGIDITKSNCRLAFAQIFKEFQVQAVINPDVQGQLTYGEVPTSFEQLLKVTTRRVGSIFRKNSGEYWIVKPVQTAPVFAWIEKLPYSRPLEVLEDDFRYVVDRDRLTRFDLNDRKRAATLLLRPPLSFAVLDLGKPDDRKKFIAMAKFADVDLAIAPEERRKVWIYDGPATVAHFVQCIAKSFGVSDSNGLFLKPVNKFVWLNLFDFRPMGEQAFGAPALKVVSDLLQVDSGRWRYLVRPKDLAIVEVKPRPLLPADLSRSRLLREEH